MAESWVYTLTEGAKFSQETAFILKRKIGAISLLASLPILCILNNFRYSKLLLWCKGTTSSCSSSSDSSDDDTTTKPWEGEHIKGEDDHNHLLQCVICLHNVCKGEKYRVLRECSHGFHVDCIDAWLLQNSTCPLCRCSVAYTPPGKKQQLQLSSEDDDQEAFYEAIIASFLSFLDHLWTWFLSPLGFEQSCQDYHAFL